MRIFALMGYIRSKTRSAGQIMEKPCVHHRGQICRTVLLKDGQNVLLDDVSDRFEKDYVSPTTRLLGQILEISYVYS